MKTYHQNEGTYDVYSTQIHIYIFYDNKMFIYFKKNIYTLTIIGELSTNNCLNSNKFNY